MQGWEVRLGIKRIEILKLMHDYIIEIGDDDIYYTWITYGVPDEPTKDDYDMIAFDDKLFYECCEEFARLVKHDK